MLTCSIDLTEFRTLVGRTLDVVEHGIANATHVAADEGAAEAKRVGPFTDRTRNLRTRIVARLVRSSGRSVTWEILSPMYYSKFVDGGTRRARPYPFMGPAFIKAERVLWREVEKIPGAVASVWP